MKKIPVFVLKSSFLVAFCCFALLNICQAQAEMSLWYIPDSPFSQRGSHHHPHSVEIPCDWNYYHRSDGKDKIIEYGIRNDGDAPLTLTLPLAFDANSALTFQVITQPTNAVLQPGEDVHFKVRYVHSESAGSNKAILPIKSDDPKHPSCAINFRIGGGGPVSNPIIVGCFQQYTRVDDFGADGMVDGTQIISRTLDMNNNILSEEEVSKDELGATLGTLTKMNTYNNQNQVLTAKTIYTGFYRTIVLNEMITNTYDANGNLTEEKVLTETTFGIYDVTHTYTYDSNNRVIKDVITYTTPFVANGIGMIDYTYDANGNLLTLVENDGGGYMFSETNTYDANNNLLTSIEIRNGTTIFSVVNTYDANNNLLTSAETYDSGLTTTTTNTYDANNNLITSQSTTPPSGFGPNITETTTNTYNSFNILIKEVIVFMVEFPVGTVVFMSESNAIFNYDANNRLLSIDFEGSIDPTQPPIFTQTTTISPCDIPQISIADPCNCFDPLNKRDNQDIITHFHDVLSVNGTPGDAVILQTGNTNFLANNLTQIANGTMLGTIPASGTLEYDFFHSAGASGAITLSVGGVLSNPFDISVCKAKSCIVVPTMSQWGLLIFGLLLLNLSIFFVQQKEMN